MRGQKKKAVAASLCCIALGVVLAAASAIGGGLDFSNLNGMFAHTQVETVSEPFLHINIFGLNNDIRFLPSEDGLCSVHYSKLGSVTAISVENETLTILQTAAERWWGDRDAPRADEQPIVIYLPQSAYEKLSVTTAGGNIIVPQFFRFATADVWSTSGDIVFYAGTSEELRIRNTDGSVRADNLVSMETDVCGSVTVLTAAGSIELSNLRALRLDMRSAIGAVALSNVLADYALIDTTESDVTFTDCDGKDWMIYSISGNIRGSLLSPKRFSVSSGIGDMEYPRSQAVIDQFVVATRSGIVRIELAG